MRPSRRQNPPPPAAPPKPRPAPQELDSPTNPPPAAPSAGSDAGHDPRSTTTAVHRRFEVSVPWMPSHIVEAANADEARAAYFAWAGILSTQHPVTATEIPDAQ